MSRCFCWLVIFLTASLLSAFSSAAAERKFDFSTVPDQQTPPGFRSAVTGQGKPGEWKVIFDNVPSALPALSPESHGMTTRAVLAQLSQDPADEHFPLLIFDQDTYRAFTLSTPCKTVHRPIGRMAAIAFR